MLVPFPTTTPERRARTSRVAAVLGILAAVLLLASCSFVRGSGTVVAQERKVPTFETVELSTSADVVITVGDRSPTLTVEADDNVVDLVLTEVEGGTLVVRTRPGRAFFGASPVVVTAGTEDLRGTGVSGSGSVTASGIDAASFEINVSGSGDVVVGGSVQDLSVRVSGSGTVDASELTSIEATVSISGSGDVMVRATETLRADVSGSGDVTYSGRPRLEAHTSGSGSVRPAGG